MKARKCTSCKGYHHTWKAYFAWYKSRNFHPRRYSVGCIFSFLQAGLNQHLALSTIKSRYWPFYSRALGLSLSLIKVFIQDVTCMYTPVCSSVPFWDLIMFRWPFRSYLFNLIEIFPRLALLIRWLSMLI